MSLQPDEALDAPGRAELNVRDPLALAVTNADFRTSRDLNKITIDRLAYFSFPLGLDIVHLRVEEERDDFILILPEAIHNNQVLRSRLQVQRQRFFSTLIIWTFVIALKHSSLVNASILIIN